MLRNVIVMIFTIASAALGICFPYFAEPLAFLPTLLMVLQLLFCFLTTTDPSTPLPAASLRMLPKFLALKMLAVPLLCWAVMQVLMPQFALGALLISGSAIGVMSPFFAFMVGADAFFVIGGVIASSLIMPLTIPLLASIPLLLEGRSATGLVTTCLNTAIYLGCCMVVPFILSRLLWAKSKRSAEWLLEHRYSLTLLCLFFTSLVVFGRFSAPIRENPILMVKALGAAVVLSLMLVTFGFMLARKLPPDRALAKIISVSTLNNVLIVIAAAEFFSLNEVLVATLYSIPMLSLGVVYHGINGYLRSKATTG